MLGEGKTNSFTRNIVRGTYTKLRMVFNNFENMESLRVNRNVRGKSISILNKPSVNNSTGVYLMHDGR